MNNHFRYQEVGIMLGDSKKWSLKGLLAVPLDLDECSMGQQFQR